MDAYLELARSILLRERRPLTPRAILEKAYKADLVPVWLYGQTQHKTLQARLSENIVAHRERSPFFRTAPGIFFLSEFQSDQSIKSAYRQPFPARRRFRDLVRGPALAIDKGFLMSIARQGDTIGVGTIVSELHGHYFVYDDPKSPDKNSVFVRTFVCVKRSAKVLSYRLGRYRDDRDGFVLRQSIGFSSFVERDDCTLFNMKNMGIIESGVKAAVIDLDLPIANTGMDEINVNLLSFIWTYETNDLLAVITLDCPSWFEPTKRRLALNNLRWMSLEDHANNLDDFDPWSTEVIPLLKSSVKRVSETRGNFVSKTRLNHS